MSLLLELLQLNEAPIADIDILGSGKATNFPVKDRKLLIKDGQKNEKYLELVKRKWFKTKQDYNVYFYNKKGGRKFLEKGLVDFDWVKTNLGEDVYQRVLANHSEDTITYIITNNTGDEKVPMTPWILAHRFGHAIYANTRRNNTGYLAILVKELVKEINFQFTSILNDLYGAAGQADHSALVASRYSASTHMGRIFSDKLLQQLFYAVGTTKTARDKNISRIFEVVMELIAQYMLQGKVTFNKTPKKYISAKARNEDGYYDHKNLRRNTDDDNEIDMAWVSDSIEGAEDNINYKLEELFDECVGKIFVM